MADLLVQTSDVSIDGVDKSMSSSVVYATAQAPEGGDVHYRV